MVSRLGIWFATRPFKIDVKRFKETPTDAMLQEAMPPAGFKPITSHSPYGWSLGPMFEKEGSETLCRGFRAAPKHMDRNGVVAAGMITTFADILLAQPVLYEVRAPFVTLRMTADYFGAARLGDWVEGTATLSGGQDGVLSVHGQIYTGELKLASIQALFKAFRPRD